MTQEMVDWITDDDEVIETVTRQRMRAEALLHRSVGIHVWSTDGRILIQRRSEDKDLHPGYWDIGAGGVVASGEDYDGTAVRELAEELGVTDVPLAYLGRGRFDSPAFCTIAALYRTTFDGPFRFNDGEVAEARFVTVPELVQMTQRLAFMPDSLALGGRFIPGFCDV